MIADTFSQGLDRLGSAVRAGLSALSHRGELAALEAGEARDHLEVSVALGLGATALAVLGGFALNFALAASIWHRGDRAFLLALFACLQLALAAALAVWAHRRLRRWQPLRETRRQLHLDGELLQTLLPGGAPAPNGVAPENPRPFVGGAAATRPGDESPGSASRGSPRDGTGGARGDAFGFHPTARGPLS